MTRVVKEYTSKNNTKYILQEFDPSRLYHPNDVRQIKRSNQEFYDVIAADKKSERMQEAEQKKVKPLTDDEKFAIAVAAQKKKDEEQAAYEAREAAKVKQHETYLASDVELAEVATTNFYTFVMECHNWLSRGYTMIDSSLYSTPSGFNSCQFVAPVASKKK